MSAENPLPNLSLPDRPNLQHLKHQARDLVDAGEATSISAAQFRIAQQYGFASWPKLKAQVESLTLAGQLKDAIDINDFETVKSLMTRFPELHSAPIGYNKNGPLTWVAECRVPRVPPSETRLAMAAWMIDNGSDVHRGGDGPLMRAALDDTRINMMKLLVKLGADVNARWNGTYPIIFAPCEALAPGSLKWLLKDGGANPNVTDAGGYTPVSMLIGTYSRNAHGKGACLNTLVEAGFPLPDTPIMAMHRNKSDLVGDYLGKDPALLNRRFSIEEIFPPIYGMPAGQGLTFTPLEGCTLLHFAAEMADIMMVERLLRWGADPNARAAIDSEGFGGHTPLFHTVISIGGRSKDISRLLLIFGADPQIKATFRKQLQQMGEPEKEQMTVFRDATPLDYARQYVEQSWISAEVVEMLEKARAGG